MLKDIAGHLHEMNITEVLSWLQKMINLLVEGLIIVDGNGKIKLINSTSKDILGLSDDELMNKNIIDLFPETDPDLLLKSPSIEVARKVKWRDRKLSIRRIPLIVGNEIPGTIVIFQDETEYSHMRGELTDLKNSVEILETILDNAYDGIIVVDEKGIITKFNRAYEEFLDIKEEDILGKHVADVIENTRMHIVVKTGKAEIGDVQKIQGNEMVASRIPIKKNGKIVGAVGKVLFQDVEELKSLAQRVESLENRINFYKNEIKRLQEAKYSFENIVTQNKKMNYLKKMARKAAESNSTVLIQGESGTGKELFAHAIHKASYQKYGAFIRVNCAAIPRELIESELFGYEEGSFTGARKDGKPGKFELASGGTIFLDEIGAMPLDMQVKLLRVLQEKEFERIGGNQTLPLNARIITATNEELDKSVAEGSFRNDLYYRVNVIRIQIPPLRERRDDIPILSRYMLKELTAELHLDEKELADETIDLLIAYDWPGNVRELHNFLERALNFSTERMIRPDDLPQMLLDKTGSHPVREIDSLADVVAQAEIDAIIETLSKTNGNRTKAAELLGIHRTSLYQKINKYNIDLSKV